MAAGSGVPTHELGQRPWRTRSASNLGRTCAQLGARPGGAVAMRIPQALGMARAMAGRPEMSGPGRSSGRKYS
jgi:hypothetical protein